VRKDIGQKEKSESQTFGAHDTLVATVAGATSAAPKHVEVVARVIAVLEALAANGHARRQRARATPVRHVVDIPDEAAHRARVEGLQLGPEGLEAQATRHVQLQTVQVRPVP